MTPSHQRSPSDRLSGSLHPIPEFPQRLESGSGRYRSPHTCCAYPNALGVRQFCRPIYDKSDHRTLVHGEGACEEAKRVHAPGCTEKRRASDERYRDHQSAGNGYMGFYGGGGVWESNPPTGGLTRSTGFEVQGPHQQPNASRADILIAYAMNVKIDLAYRAQPCAYLPPHYLPPSGRADGMVVGPDPVRPMRDATSRWPSLRSRRLDGAPSSWS